jgi:hypothetical protein
LTRAIRSLLGSIIDYAGLFPPAELTMDATVSNYAAYRASEFGWTIGRLVVPVSGLAEFESSAFNFVTRRTGQQRDAHAEPGSTWRLSVLAGAELASDVAAIAAFNNRHAAERFLIDTVELKATQSADFVNAMRRFPDGLCAYFEVSSSSDDSLLAAVRAAGARVKIRTGGITPQAFPTSSELAEFLVRCAAVGVPFKATAGLHHPIRAEHRLTYAVDSPRGMMHGFLNLFLAAAGVRAGMTAHEAAQLLDESSAAAFRFDEEGVSWREHRWSNEHLRRTRHEFAISFGSCSFQEPLDDLKALRLV